ncbi:nephronectin a isoform X6 [Corythoichthys intestinalis]|uniref:nephronectin a isoform X6 n=1 Tax=Corythoichthys intestinalis TaxID=161448 RepID=UPI0025A604F0|nr:nephronectin a isoform X6 [Corythoichthys intestinalis]
MDSWIKFIFMVATFCWEARAEFDGRWPRQMASSNGLCRYGARVDCCWGWTRRSWGHCQPLCPSGCKHGDCVGPNKCKCHAGFTGKTCNQDLNECGLKPRPCKHRCMNTYGSYKCYCLNGFMMMPDGTCGNLRTCGMANCQYGCEVLKGEVRCQCPSPGLQLASDGRTCVDVDECASGIAVCPRFRKCINTFGSYICKCHDGFDLQYINGKYQCIDVDECSLEIGRCGVYATCFNTPGSYKCKCKDGYRGMGRDCKPIPKVAIEPPRPGKLPPSYHNHLPGIDQRRTTTTQRPALTHRWVFTIPPKTTTTAAPTTTTAAPKRKTTTSPRKPATQKPFVPTRRPPAPTRKPYVPPEPETPAATPSPPPQLTTVDNSIHKDVTKQRGDVHIPRNHNHNAVLDFDIELGNTADEAKDDPDSGFLSCSFDDGLCGWIRDNDGDVHWETTPDPAGGRYLTIPEVGDKRTGRGARLVLPLGPPWNEGNLCLSFRHKLAGHHVGMLQVFVKKGNRYSPAVWGRTGGNGWRQTQITLWGAGLESVVLKGERGRGRSGEMAVDDISLAKGSCADDRNPTGL